ncbi:hypothetical protein POM88_039250 [Heracleum sosnowskyi]|uniref:Uncharacterized protein n=1 Tax=Heracleum sosnowskyi TaxID=360622 RepID=A0AAD8HC82_9APIA|nr:hypothetical protein POM88_039250 [Heracleum sosnowskyi]
MNFDENVISFSNMLNSDSPVYDEYTTPTPDINFSQHHGGERSGEVIVIPSQVLRNLPKYGMQVLLPKSQNIVKRIVLQLLHHVLLNVWSWRTRNSEDQLEEKLQKRWRKKGKEQEMNMLMVELPFWNK